MEYEMKGSKPIVLTRSVNIEMSDIETLPPIVTKVRLEILGQHKEVALT
jgi:hypothetical protein